MVSFKLNILKLNENVLRFKKIKKACNLDVSSTYKSLSNIESGWNDNDAKSFSDTVKKDKYKIDDYLETIDKVYKQIEILSNNFANLFAKYGYNKQSKIVYNDEYYKLCLDNLNNILSYVNNALYYINCCSFNSSFASYYKVSSLRNELVRLKNEIRTIYNNIVTFKNSIDKISSNIQMGMNKIGEADLDIKKMTYNWNIVNTTIKSESNDIKHNSTE